MNARLSLCVTVFVGDTTAATTAAAALMALQNAALTARELLAVDAETDNATSYDDIKTDPSELLATLRERQADLWADCTLALTDIDSTNKVNAAVVLRVAPETHQPEV